MQLFDVFDCKDNACERKENSLGNLTRLFAGTVLNFFYTCKGNKYSLISNFKR